MVRVSFSISPITSAPCRFLTCLTVYWISHLGDRHWILRNLTGAAMFKGKQMMGRTELHEALEPRRLMSASLVSGVLTVKGTTDADSLVLSLKSGDLTKLEVNVNSVTSDFALTSITKVVVYGSAGNDMIKVDNIFDVVPFGVTEKGGDGNDLLIGGNRIDDVLGGLGDDELRGMAGNDLLDGGDGLDKFVGYAGNDSILGGLANDLLDGGSGNDILKGGFGDDLLKGSAGLDSLFGDDGLDQLFGGLNSDFLDGGLGNDTLDGGAALDSLIGGLGDDHFVWDKLTEIIDKTVNDIF